jgi:hypothetical protein
MKVDVWSFIARFRQASPGGGAYDGHMRWRGWTGALALGAVAACGVDLVGTLPAGGGDAASSGPSDGGPSVSDDATTLGVQNDDAATVLTLPDVVDPPPVVDDAGPTATPDAGDGGTDAGSVCILPSHACAPKTPCCLGQCTANDTCGVCSPVVGTPCSHQGDCCKGTWCGSVGKSGVACQACFKKDAFCNADVECCSGTCDRGPGNGNNNGNCH